MAFFENQIRARRKTMLLIVLFFLAVGLIVLALNAVVIGATIIITNIVDSKPTKATRSTGTSQSPRGTQSPSSSRDKSRQSVRSPSGVSTPPAEQTLPPPQDSSVQHKSGDWWKPETVVVTSIITLLIILLASLWKSVELSGGGPAVAQMLGAVQISSDTGDPSERKMLNIVEEMSIASGMTMPKVYILQDSSINAMAAGLNTSNAAVIVTTGAIRRLNRDELQGVVAHEFSHILNSDMRMNVRLIGMLFGILIIAKIGYLVLQAVGQGRIRMKDKGGAIILVVIGAAIALVIIGYVGLFFGKLIQSAVSRQREYLADASSVQFTRNPRGIVGALKKIGSFSLGSQLDARSSMEMAHMFFGDPVSRMFGNIFSTHPPLAKRIRAIDPSFDGKFDALTPELAEEVSYQRDYGPNNYFASLAGGGKAAVSAEHLSAMAATVTPAQMEYAAAVISEIPADMRKIVRSRNGAMAVVLGMLLDAGAELRASQVAMIKDALGQDIAELTECNYDAVSGVSVHDRIPLLTIALPALEQMDLQGKKALRHVAKQIIESDSKVELFEYLFYKIMWHRLRGDSEVLDKTRIRHVVLSPLLPDATVLVSAIAHAGDKSPQSAAAAMENGMRILQHAQAILPSVAPDIAKLDRALERWMHAGPRLKAKMMDAAAAAASEDGVIDLEEAQLLRSLAILLECPLPPMMK